MSCRALAHAAALLAPPRQTGVALLLTCLTLALLSCSGGEPPYKEPRLFFLGVDGASWKVIGPLLDAGELPGFARLVKEGAYMSRFETMESTASPVVWTTVATGRSPADHGIADFAERLGDGTRIPISSRSRKVKAIWEVASEHGVSTGVGGWWASWPAEEIEGYVITDHANPAFSEFLFEDQTYWTADRKKLTALQRDFYPLDLAPHLSRHWISKESFDYLGLGRRSQLSSEQIAILRTTPWNSRTLYSIFKTFFNVDMPVALAMKDLYVERPTRLSMLYMRGPDPIQHYGWDLVEPERYHRKRPNLERDREMVKGVYRYVDAFLEELLEELDDETWLIVASDHGAEPAPGAESPHFGSRRPGGHTAAAKGVLFIHGPNVRRGYVLERGTPEDLMPTMAWLLGLPLSEELVGTVLTEAFTPEFVAKTPHTKVASYGAREVGATGSAASPADDAMLESLRALGYIE